MTVSVPLGIGRLVDALQRRWRGAESSQTRWERRWADPGYVPPWTEGGARSCTQRAVDDGWLGSEGTVLDIGCGEGSGAMLLAACGLDVVGIDCSPAAIKRARTRAATAPRAPRFAVCDVTREVPPGGPFTGFVDICCFHAMSPTDADAYCRNLLPRFLPGARGLVVARLRDGRRAHPEGLTRTEALAKVQHVFGTDWTIATVTELDLDAVKGERPALAIRLRRESVV